MTGKLLDENGLVELWSLIEAADAEIFASVAKMKMITYVGTGIATNTIIFSDTPKFVIIAQGDYTAYGLFVYGCYGSYQNGSGYFNSATHGTYVTSWNGNELTYSCEHNGTAGFALNASGTSYTCVAFY